MDAVIGQKLQIHHRGRFMMLKKLMGLASCAALIASPWHRGAEAASYFDTISSTVAGRGARLGIRKLARGDSFGKPDVARDGMPHQVLAVRPLSPNWKPSLSWAWPPGLSL